ncbi:MAG: hypothetical protein OQL19_03900 [Gammaproteobacteria bacterium]|nr:hypothetical protein [Gammaproteobacteria bacterium]
MIEPHQNWFIATKKVVALSEQLEKELTAIGVDVLHGETFIHAHFFIPEDVYPHADEAFQKEGFTLTDTHPPVCSIGIRDDYEIFEKRIPIIEVTEANALKHLFDKGVCMSGGAGKPHIHVKIPNEKREEVVNLLAAHKYYLKQDLLKDSNRCH